MRQTVVLLVALSVAVFACGDDDMPVLDASQPDVTPECTEDRSCDDGVFCNGMERCFMGGCNPGTAPCEEEQCDEARNVCDEACEVADADGDGVDSIACGGTDCDDNDPLRYPGNAELCDDRDQDCDPDTFGDLDLDGDSYVSSLCCDGDRCGDDCADGVQSIHPGATEICDFVDQDCDGNIDEGVLVDGFEDEDSDLHGSERTTRACPGESGTSPSNIDCDDADVRVHGAHTEAPDGLDNDCDGRIDEDAGPVVWYRDADHDGYGDPSEHVTASEQPEGYSALPSDCDDSEENISPGAVELCNGIDDNCDGLAGAGSVGDREDDDGDGHGDIGCGGDDCDDRDEFTYANAAELCDGVDNDCDGVIDENAVPINWYVDEDGDGYGADADPRLSCDRVFGRTPRGGDCDDTDPNNHPDQRELCDGEDNDCDLEVDEGGLGSWVTFVDADNDGFGDSTMSAPLCFGDTLPPGYAFRDGDCDESDSDVHPGAVELCDEVDNDCDSRTDEDVTIVDWYHDRDGDSYGAGAVAETSCSRPIGQFSATRDDCDDDRSAVFPGATEVCDGVDQDCDTMIDEGVTSTYYLDDDGDDYGTGVFEACPVAGAPPAGYAAEGGDCAPLDEDVHPLATEICDEVDQDCDSRVDEGFATTFYYPDGDGDGVAAITASGGRLGCAARTGEARDRTDCDDMNSLVYPGAMETCDGLNNDCDGAVDEGSTLCTHASYVGICQAPPASAGSCACSETNEADCDGARANGCEVNTDTDRQNCGGCSVVCGSTQSCEAGVCTDTHVLDIVAGYRSFAVLREGGLVQAWGDGADGFFPSSVDQRTAVSVFEGMRVSALDINNVKEAFKHRCLVTEVDGGARELQCAGPNNTGQLGLGFTGGTHGYGSIDAPGITDWLAVAVGPLSTVGLRANGTVYTWGYNASGELGRVVPSGSAVPTAIAITDASQIGFGFNHGCALRSTGQVTCWGGSSFGSRGKGGAAGMLTSVVDDLDHPIENIAEIAIGYQGGCARSSAGQVWCWGRGVAGVSGGLDYAVSVHPTGATHIACEDDACCLSTSAGNAMCWGQNVQNRLGLGAGGLSFQPAPALVQLSSGAPLTNVVDVTIGDRSACALLSGDRATCWGENTGAELGDGTFTARPHAGAPTLVSGL